jgi:hypothetical protein
MRIRSSVIAEDNRREDDLYKAQLLLTLPAFCTVMAVPGSGPGTAMTEGTSVPADAARKKPPGCLQTLPDITTKAYLGQVTNWPTSFGSVKQLR